MTMYTVIYRELEHNTITDEKREGKTKKDLLEMYRGNGIKVLAVLTDADILKIKTTINPSLAEVMYENGKKKHLLYVQQIL